MAAPPDGDRWFATPLTNGARLARTADNGAAILVPVAKTEELRIGLRTFHVQYSPHRELTIRSDDGEEQGAFAVFECDGAIPELVAYFLRVGESLPLDSTFDASVRTLFDLFRNLARRGARTAQGLWAELFLIARAASPEFMLEAWHSEASELHDFVGDDDVLEAKSSSTGARAHVFSLDQLTTKAERTVIASLLLEKDDQGANVFDLMADIRVRVSADLALRLENIVGKSLGDAWQDARETRFKVESAEKELRFFNAVDIPRVPSPSPPAVSHVHFRADLSGVAPIGASAHRVLLAFRES